MNLNSPRLYRVLFSFFFFFFFFFFSSLCPSPLLLFPYFCRTVLYFLFRQHNAAPASLCLPSSSSHNQVGKWLTAGNQARPGLLPTTHICYPHHTTCNPCLLTGRAGVCFDQWIIPSLRMSPMFNCSSSVHPHNLLSVTIAHRRVLCLEDTTELFNSLRYHHITCDM